MKISLVDDTKIEPIHIYTDGSCWPNPGPGGWAAVLMTDDGKSPEYLTGAEILTTNIRMEGRAIIQAMNWLEVADDEVLRRYGGYTNHPTVEIITDSEYWVKTLKEWAPTWERDGWTRKSKGGIKNLAMVQEAYGLYQKVKGYTTLTWTRGHVGTPGNELADQAAGEARIAEVERIRRLKENS